MSDAHDRHATYSLLTAGFNLGLAVLATRDRAGRRLGGAPPWQDLVLLAVATHKVSRLVAKDRVTAPIREPVTEGEQQKKPAGRGARRALGELVTCPYCVAPWISLATAAAYVSSPKPTRVAATVIGIASVSDFLNRAYARLQGD